jgi:deoxyribonuclease-4
LKKVSKAGSEDAQGRDLLGAHFSIAGGLERALREAAGHNCGACQIFTKNANTWRERTISGEEARQFAVEREANRIRFVAAHTSYLINLAVAESETAEKSREALALEIERSQRLGLSFVVLHPGAHKGLGEAEGIRSVSGAINSVLGDMKGQGPMLLLETTAGQGTCLGHRFEQLAEILDRVRRPEQMGVCLDTSHIFAAGYDIRSAGAYRETMARFDDIIGLGRLKLLHLNDSKKALGTRVDRHAHIGRGCIGPDAFGMIMNDARLAGIPKILETPKEKGGKDWDAVNLKVLRGLVAGADIGR